MAYKQNPGRGNRKKTGYGIPQVFDQSPMQQEKETNPKTSQFRRFRNTNISEELENNHQNINKMPLNRIKLPVSWVESNQPNYLGEKNTIMDEGKRKRLEAKDWKMEKWSIIFNKEILAMLVKRNNGYYHDWSCRSSCKRFWG